MPPLSPNSSSVSEEQLFRRFRRPWLVELWQRIGGSGSLLALAAVLLLTVGISAWALTYLSSPPPLPYLSVDQWREKIDSANPRQLPLLFDLMFQAEDDRVIHLGVNYLVAEDPQRTAAAESLRNVLPVWQQWELDRSSAQINRAAEALATHVVLMGPQEQSLAAYLTRRFLLWPVGADRQRQAKLLAACETVISQARQSNLSSLAPLSNRSEVIAQWETQLNPAASRLDENRRERVPAFEAGFSSTRLPSETFLASQKTANPNHARPRSQVPLVNGDGRRIEVDGIDPSSLALPGGLIPITLPGSYRDGGRPFPAATPQSTFGNPGDRNSPTTDAADSRPPSANVADTNDRASPQPSLAEALKQRNIADTHMVPGRSNRLPAGPPERDANGGNTAIAADTFGPSGDRRTASDAARRLPQNPYRDPQDDRTPENLSPDQSARPLEETMRRVPNADDLQTSNPRSEPAESWDAPPPQGPISQWSHIQVMQQLRSAEANLVSAAEKELQRRGFDRNYLSVAYRLTSSDPVERFQLIENLNRNSAVEPLPFLRWLSADPHPEIRAAANEQIAKLSSDPIRTLSTGQGNGRKR